MLSASLRRQKTSSASITAEHWGTAPTLTREPSTAWSGSVTSATTTARWPTRPKTTCGWRYSAAMHLDEYNRWICQVFQSSRVVSWLVWCEMFVPHSWTRCVLMTTAAAAAARLRTDWLCPSCRNSCWRTTVRVPLWPLTVFTVYYGVYTQLVM